jgi:NADH-quinone oxidoreductase subunit A
MELKLLPILLFAAAATGLALAMLGIGSLLGPKRNSAVKRMPYESGMDPIHDAHKKFDVRFHLVAIAFLIFDVELLFLYPWAVASRPGVEAPGIDATIASAAEAGVTLSRGLIFGEVMVFIALLAVGLVYAWKKGVFQWR